MPKKYVEKRRGEVFKKKTELVVELLEGKLREYKGKLPRNMITLLTDASYATKHVLCFAHEKGIIYVAKLKKTFK